MVTKELITVIFEDHGQDFLEWDIKDGVVVDCRPFQGWHWNGTKVHNTNIKPGDILEITPVTGGLTTLSYPVEKVMEKCSFCEAVTERGLDGKLPEGWGKAQIAVPGKEAVDVTFCPDHRKEAEAKLDLAFQE